MRTKDSTIYFEEIGWTIRLPSDLKIADSTNESAVEWRGQKIVENLNNQKIDMTNTRNLITAKRDDLNWFKLAYNSSNGITNETWKQADSAYYALVLKTLIKKLSVKVDTINLIVLYDGIEFVKHQAIFAVNEKVSLNTNHLCTFYKGHCIIIGYVYTDSVVGDEISNMLITSKFAAIEKLLHGKVN
jgi:hypothetical protein